MTRKRLRPELIVDSQINLHVHEETRQKLLELAKAKGYGNGRGPGISRLAREVLEKFVEEGFIMTRKQLRPYKRRLRPEILVDSQINLKIHAITKQKLLELAKANGYGNGCGEGHCRLAREILERFVEDECGMADTGAVAG